MKKKLLSLVLAGAMVASTSVSAFADQSVDGDGAHVGAGTVENAPIEVESVGNGRVNGPDNKQYSTEVQIKGDVEDNQGQTKPGTLSVTVATAANFKVSRNGTFSGTNISVNNSGTDDIDVFAYKFIDTKSNGGITVRGKSDLQGKNRTNVALNIKGNLDTAYLGSDAGTNNGIYTDENLRTPGTSPIRIATVAPGSEKQLELKGEAGKSTNEPVSEAVDDNFTLVLKIAKTNKSAEK